MTQRTIAGLLQKILQKLHDQEPAIARAFDGKRICVDTGSVDRIHVEQKRLVLSSNLLALDPERFEWLIVHEGWHYVLNHHERYILILSELFAGLRRRHPRISTAAVMKRVQDLWREAADLEVNQMIARRKGAPKDMLRVGRGAYGKLPKGRTAEYYVRKLARRRS